MKKRLLVIVFYIVFVPASLAMQNETLFERATAVYNEGDYNKAIEYYQQILENGKHSAELYFNLGNCYYKLDQTGPSIYYYEKALLLKPNDSEVLNNLGYAQNTRLDAFETMPKTAMEKLYESTIAILSFEQWAKVAVLMSIIFVLLYLVYYFFNSVRQKRIFFILSMVSLTLCIFSLVFAYLQFNSFKYDNPAIIFENEVRVLSEPNKRSQEVFTLHEGTKVNVLENLDEWKKIQISDGQTGWTASENLKLLKDF
jgi:tetratricopeptide (TPR) repeat protein